jgi:hypothetical protein
VGLRRRLGGHFLIAHGVVSGDYVDVLFQAAHAICCDGRDAPAESRLLMSTSIGPPGRSVQQRW